jgi:hypothetical protein
LSERLRQIGFSQRIQLDWLEQTINHVLAGGQRNDILDALHQTIKKRLSGTADRGSIEKTLSILMKIWVAPPSKLEPLRQEGLFLLKQLPIDMHISVHWGMSMSVYPFFGAVAASVGRLLHLQKTVSAEQVQRRLREKYGERQTVSRSARRILRVFIDWNVLAETEERGIYAQGKTLRISHNQLISWLVEALLHSNENQSSDLNAIRDTPFLFPFKVDRLTPEAISHARRLIVTRHGLTETIVTLK